jgi:hypothetical protein
MPVRFATGRRRALTAAAACVVVLLVAAGAGFAWWQSRGGPPPGPRAAIVDQLAITDPDPQFIAAATDRLKAAGYRVDYYPAQAVTVNLYRDLPQRGYSFVILRSHSSGSLPVRDAATGIVKNTPSVGLFTNEEYSQGKHLAYQYAHVVTRDLYDDRDIPWAYFGITPEFIRSAARGQFPGATVILMGCDGLAADDLAQAFIAKGATDFVSWNAAVSAEHTDAATEKLLEHLLDERLAPREAVARTMDEVGPDPSFGSHLLAYP